MDENKKFLDVDVEKAAGSNRLMWFTASTENRDRDGDVLIADDWKLQSYKKNPVFLWAHDYSRPPIGKSIEIEKGNGKLRSKVEFVSQDIDPFAEQVRRLYAEGFMRTVSVGFMPYKTAELTEEDKKQRPELQWGKRISAELLEFSAVPVPSNPMALQNGFLEAVVKGMSPHPSAAPAGAIPAGLSPLLLVQRDGKLDPRLCKAAVAALLGARGGLPMLADQDKDAQIAILKTLGVQWGGKDLRADFDDVWGDELLDVLQHAAEVQAKDAEVKPEQLDAVADVLSGMAKNMEAITAALK
jgi:hypothetical protein